MDHITQDTTSNTCFTCLLRGEKSTRHQLENRPIAYFCAEYGIDDDLPLYAGGLGILAGDFVREAGKQNIPIIAIGLFYKKSFSTYRPDDGHDITINLERHGFTLLKDDAGQPIVVHVDADSRSIAVQAWTKTYGSAHLLLLDTDFDQNTEEDRMITHRLYDGKFQVKVLQELILGFGGIKIIRALGVIPSIYHLNEGHTSFAALALAIEYLHDHPNETSLKNAMRAVKSGVVATKHTILPAAGIHFKRSDFEGIIDTYCNHHGISFDEFFELGLDADHDEPLFSTTKFVVSHAVRTNAVSMLHAVFEKREHPHSPLIAITNGINEDRWLSPLWGKNHQSELSDKELWEVHQKHRKNLTAFIKEKTGAELNDEALTIVWARRFAAYKRPKLLFSDLKRLEAMLSISDKPVQIVISGQASMFDDAGIGIIKTILERSREDRFKNKIIYVPDYAAPIARHLLYGADVWLSTPIRGMEACGTSSMKSGLNGVLQCSTSDGWLEEVDWTDKGWILPAEETEKYIYDRIENDIMPTFYNRNEEGVPLEWVKRMRKTMNIVRNEYTTERMLEKYLERLYLPCESVVE